MQRDQLSWVRRDGYAAYLIAINLAMRLPGHALRTWLLRYVARVDVGQQCAFQRGVRLTTKGLLCVGDHVNVNAGALLDARGGLSIGSRVNISQEVMILTADHDPARPDFAGRERSVTIGDRVWIASRAIVLPGSRIGDGALIAAGAVVHGDVPADAIMAGNPARQIAVRPPDAQSQLHRFAQFLH